MSFLNEVQAKSVARDTRCGVTRWLESQDDLDDATLRAAAATVNVASTHRAMQARGFTFGRQMVERHFNGSCGCPTS